MFEHLGPLPKIKIKKKAPNYRLYFSCFLLSLVTFLVSWSIRTGANIEAATPDYPEITIKALSVDQTVVKDTPNVNVFPLLISVPRAGVELKKIQFYANGLYRPEILAGLKIFHRGVQLGQLSAVDQQGNITFDLQGYILPSGDSELDLTLGDSKDLAVNDLFSFVLANETSLLFTYGGQTILPKAEWPVAGGMTRVVETGSLRTINNLPKQEFVLLADTPGQLADFSLTVDGERADLRTLTLAIKPADNKADDKFILKSGEQVLATASLQAEKIHFILDQPLSLSPNELTPLQVVGQLASGDYQLNIDQITASGLVSGQDLIFNSDEPIAQPQARAFYLDFHNQDIDKELNQGWYNVAKVLVTARGAASLDLRKLTWQIKSQAVTISGAKIMLGNQVISADVITNDQKVIVKADWDKPWQITDQGTDIKLLLNIGEFKEGGFIQTSLLADQASYQKGNLTDNILWSKAGEIYNGYLLPGLPTLPQVLTN